MSGKLAAEDAMDLSQGKIIDGDNEILTTDTKLWLKHLNINRLAKPCKYLTLFTDFTYFNV